MPAAPTVRSQRSSQVTPRASRLASSSGCLTTAFPSAIKRLPGEEGRARPPRSAASRSPLGRVTGPRGRARRRPPPAAPACRSSAVLPAVPAPVRRSVRRRRAWSRRRRTPAPGSRGPPQIRRDARRVRREVGHRAPRDAAQQREQLISRPACQAARAVRRLEECVSDVHLGREGQHDAGQSTARSAGDRWTHRGRRRRLCASGRGRRRDGTIRPKRLTPTHCSTTESQMAPSHSVRLASSREASS
jgi:hypothetical protein